MILLAIWGVKQILTEPSPDRKADLLALWRGLRDGWQGKFGPPDWFKTR